MPAPPTPPPPEVLAILDGMMCLPGVQAHHYAVVRRMLIDKLPLEAYSSSQLRTMTGKSKTTCKGIRRWLTARIKTGELVALTGGQNSDLGQDSVPWMVPSSETDVQPVPPNHEAESRRGAESCPALQKLLEIGWGQSDGRQVQDPEALVRAHGQAAILAAVKRATCGDIKNPAAFVSWCLQQQPKRDQEPTLYSVPVPVTARSVPDSLNSISPAAEDLPAPETPPGLQVVLDWLNSKVRPKTWKVWFEVCRLTPGADKGVVQFWTDNHYAADWLSTRFGDLIREGVHKFVGAEVVVEFKAYGNSG
jgi:hypothetical protein